MARRFLVKPIGLAFVVLMLVTARAVSAPQGTESDALVKWLAAYDEAFNARDLDRLATFYDSGVTVFEGSGVNDGWADYRGRHLGPELKAFEGLEFGHSEVQANLAPDGRAAYITARYFIKAKMGERMLDNVGLATYVVIKADDGAWRILHSHTSGRPRQR